MSDQHLKVLLIEDNSGDARLIGEMLLEALHARFELELADRLATGLARLGKGDIDALLLDLGLPDSRGYDTFVAARAQAWHVPIIVLTGLGDETVAFRAVQDGAQDYLIKGQVDARLLERSIRYAIERKKAEQALRQKDEQLRQAQKMESVGRLAGGVAHDFNNLLGVILGYSEVLEERLDGHDELRKYAYEIRKAGERAASLTRQLLAFSRQQVLEPKVLDLNTIVADIENMLRRLIGADVELTTVPGPDLGHVRADQGQIEQVIMNLAVNARDAMPQGGKLIIETANVELDEAFARQHPPSIPGRYVRLAVTDTGTGMDKQTQNHIFEPFFTTKGKDEGTGLGLSVVYGIVKQSGGYIWVYSEPGNGTTFKIYLALVEGAVEDTGRNAGPAKSGHGWETILLVEDEESLRHLTRALLVRSGYTVLDAGNAAHALEIAHQYQGTIQLLLTDMVLPDISGGVLAGKMALLRPDMRVVIVSGYTEYAAAGRGSLEFGSCFLQKPFTRDALTHKVREVLDTAVSVKF